MNEDRIIGLQEAANNIISVFKQERADDIVLPADNINLPDNIRISSDISPENIEETISQKYFKTVIAIDGGSSTLLSSGNFGVGVCRAAKVSFIQNKSTGAEISPEWLLAYGDGFAVSTLKELANANEVQINNLPDWINIIDTGRQILEYSYFRDAVRQASKPDLILLDGALKRSPYFSDLEFRKVLTDCYQEGITVIGISKSSTLRWANNCPLVSRFTETTQDIPAGGVWYIRISDLAKGFSICPDIPDIYIASLYTGIGPVVRLDIPSIYRNRVEQVISGLADKCNDPEFPGYPYPLADAHRNTRISLQRKKELAERLKLCVIDNGIDSRVFDAAFSDYHDILNADLSNQKLASLINNI
ncbi:MAG: DNA double-strand break repair nuclease NurA [candidate division Zixibacteria bacterium]|nr:DNA double-strand break repair nuclease NurA [candidate division Zixibacteria bacterium]